MAMTVAEQVSYFRHRQKEGPPNQSVGLKLLRVAMEEFAQVQQGIERDGVTTNHRHLLHVLRYKFAQAYYHLGGADEEEEEEENE